MTEEHNADETRSGPVLVFGTAERRHSLGETVPQCMAPGCEKPIRARGHCATHYRTLRTIVNDPKTEYTWKILGDAGVVPLRIADERERVDTAGFRDEILTKLNEASDQEDLANG